MSTASEFHKDQVVVLELRKRSGSNSERNILGGFDLPGRGARICVSTNVPTHDGRTLGGADPDVVHYQGRVTGKLELPSKTGICVDINGYGEVMVWNIDALRHDVGYADWNRTHKED